MAPTVEHVSRENFVAAAPQLPAVGSADHIASADLVRFPDRCSLHVVREGGVVRAYLHRYMDDRLPVLRLAGEEGCAAMLLDFVPPGKKLLMVQSHLQGVVESAFPSAPSYREHLMSVTRSDATLGQSTGVTRLVPEDATELLQLFLSSEFASRAAQKSVASYSQMLAEENAFGLRSGNRLVAVAVAFLLNSSFGMVGSVFTDKDHRGRGYATSVTSAATGRVLLEAERCLLYVRTGNLPAVHIYRKLGYVTEEDWTMFDFGTGIVP